MYLKIASSLNRNKNKGWWARLYIEKIYIKIQDCICLNIFLNPYMYSWLNIIIPNIQVNKYKYDKYTRLIKSRRPNIDTNINIDAQGRSYWHLKSSLSTSNKLEKANKIASVFSMPNSKGHGQQQGMNKLTENLWCIYPSILLL